jgi:hypothetical protein
MCIHFLNVRGHQYQMELLTRHNRFHVCDKIEPSFFFCCCTPVELEPIAVPRYLVHAPNQSHEGKSCELKIKS